MLPRYTAVVERDGELEENCEYDNCSCEGVVGELIRMATVECGAQTRRVRGRILSCVGKGLDAGADIGLQVVIAVGRVKIWV